MAKKKKKKKSRIDKIKSMLTADSLAGFLKNSYIPLAIFGVTLAFRLFRLTAIWSYHDEAEYCKWAMMIKAAPLQNWDISMNYSGIMPLNLILCAISQSFIRDPLTANRLVSVISGAFTAVALYLTGKSLFSKKVGILSSLLFAVLPYFIFFNRLALHDSLFVAFGSFALFYVVKLVREGNVKYSVGYGIFLALALLDKQIAYVIVFFLPAALIFLSDKIWKRIKDIRLYVSYLIAGIVYSPILIKYYSKIMFLATDSLKATGERQLTIEGLLKLWFNISVTLKRLSDLITIPFMVIAVLSLIYALMRRDKKTLFILSLGMIPIVMLVLITMMAPHYIMLFLSILTIAMAAFMIAIYDQVRDKLVEDQRRLLKPAALIVLILLLLPGLRTGYYLYFSPYDAYLSFRSDVKHWIAGGGSGEQWRKFVNYSLKESANKKIVLLGYLFDQNVNLFPVYFGNNPNIITGGPELYRSGFLDKQFPKIYPEFKKKGFEVWMITMSSDVLPNGRPTGDIFSKIYNLSKPFKIFYGYDRSSRVNLFKL